jgi:leader peptidase (prepilin peptidase)/N-methyltransferase
MITALSLFGGFCSGFAVKQIINWLSIDGYKIYKNNYGLEFLSGLAWVWAFSNLPVAEAGIFSLLFSILAGIALVDYMTFQIPLIFILAGIVLAIAGVAFKVIFLTAAIWGIFVGAVIPLIIMSVLWIITKRQGMGYGDIQLGFVLGAWLGPMRMAITLFTASVLSLLTWIAFSLTTDFDKNRAMPMAPFLAIAGIGVFIGSFYYPEFFHLLIIQ